MENKKAYKKPLRFYSRTISCEKFYFPRIFSNSRYIIWKEISFKLNKRNDTRFNNRAYSLFFLMGIFLKHLRLIPNILKWHNCKIFTKLVPSLTPSRSSHRRCSIKKCVLKNLRNFARKHVLEFLLNKVAGH